MGKLSKYLLMLLLVITGPAFSLPTAHAATGQETIRESLELTHGWRFIKRDVPGGEQLDLDDSGWQAVDLPHTYNVVDMLMPKNITEDRPGIESRLTSLRLGQPGEPI